MLINVSKFENSVQSSQERAFTGGKTTNYKSLANKVYSTMPKNLKNFNNILLKYFIFLKKKNNKPMNSNSFAKISKTAQHK